jgi:hypothetical protein
MAGSEELGDPPAFVAISNSARQLLLLLRCIGLGEKCQVQISDDGVRFSVEDSRAMEGKSCRGLLQFRLIIAGQAWRF